jgi:uncharacterized membrane protein HdeD (DUF308 family)
LFTAHSINIRSPSDQKRENVLYTLNVQGAIARSHFVAGVLINAKAWLFGLHPSLDGPDSDRFDRVPTLRRGDRLSAGGQETTMSMNPHDPNSLRSLGGATERLRSRWGWFVAYGALCLIFGVAALILAAVSTLAVVFFVALMLILAGGVEIMIGVNSRDWPSFFLWVISGLFYLVFGAFALARPEVAAAVLTAVVGMGFLVAGLVRIWLGARLPAGPKAFIVLAGVVTTLLGGLIIAGWPGNTMVILGTLFGVDMVFYGASWIALGLKLRH